MKIEGNSSINVATTIKEMNKSHEDINTTLLKKSKELEQQSGAAAKIKEIEKAQEDVNTKLLKKSKEMEQQTGAAFVSGVDPINNLGMNIDRWS